MTKLALQSSRKMKVFLRNGSGSTGYSPKNNLDLYLINKNQFQVGCKPTCERLRKKLEDKTGEYIYDLRKGKHFVKCYKKDQPQRKY